MSISQTFTQTVEDIIRTTPIGSTKRAITNSLYGINHRSVKSATKKADDQYGLTFITRPQLNLSTDNVRNIRQLYPLLNGNNTSIQRFVRCTLDPRLQFGDEFDPAIICPLVDPYQAFIPVLSNNLKSVSGWPDITSPVYTSKEGLYKEQYSQVDGSYKIYNNLDIDITYNNMVGNPIIYMYYVWLVYMSSVFEGTMVPYTDMIRENEIDYMTRVYRLVLDPAKQYVRYIGATGVSFPKNVPIGQFFDYNDEKPYNDQTSSFTIRMHTLGVEYMDDILVREFNQVVCIFNPNMRDESRDGSMYKLPYELLTFFNHRGYPRINQNNYELEWWIPKSMYEASKNILKNVTGVDVRKLEDKINNKKANTGQPVDVIKTITNI